MLKSMKVLIGLGILLIIAGFIGSIYGEDNLSKSNRDDNVFRKTTDSFFGRMMYGAEQVNSSEKIDMEILVEKVESYINLYDEPLEVSDIFTFDDSDYYFSIIEEETGLGAMELLVNPYTGDIYPEYGPNMMWNQKYGMHNNGMGYGMMGRNGMMGGRGMMGGNYYNNNYDATYSNDGMNTLSKAEAIQNAKDYIESNVKEGYTVPEGGHEFYGYFTFHVEKEHETVGMLSVNGFTGQVWYHDWHGTVSELIDSHESEDEH